jgi:hypothetical protein
MKRSRILLLMSIMLAACAPQTAPASTARPVPSPRTSTPLPRPALTATPVPTVTPVPTATPVPTVTPVPTATSDPFAAYRQYTIPALRARAYGQAGAIEIVQVLEEQTNFTRYLISYPSMACASPE